MPEVSCPKNSIQNSGQKILQMTSEFWWIIHRPRLGCFGLFQTILWYHYIHVMISHFDQTLRQLWFWVEKQKMIAEFFNNVSRILITNQLRVSEKLGSQWDLWAKHFSFQWQWHWSALIHMSLLVTGYPRFSFF